MTKTSKETLKDFVESTKNADWPYVFNVAFGISGHIFQTETSQTWKAHVKS